MQNFFGQVFNDLRARRLLPVAALLVAGLIAAPIVLSKSGDDTPATAPAPSTSQKQAKPEGPEALAQVTLEDALREGNGSSLSSFDSNDPFAPPEKVLKAARDEAQGDTGQLAGPEGGALTPGTDTGTGTPGGTGGGGGGGTDQGGGGGTKTSEFTYVLDVTFFANGHKRRIKNLSKLDMLPNELNPLLIYMGVTENAGNAVFMVDATLDAAGEGKCKPSGDDCAFLYLGAGSEEEFTNDDGDSYRLIINEIKRVKIGDESGTAASSDGDDATASKASKAAARAAIQDTSKARRFEFPMLADVVVESGESIDDSTGDDNSR